MNAKNELQRLKDAAIPRAQWSDVLTVTGEGKFTPEEETALANYFAHFAKPDDGKCICCGAKQGGGLMDGLMGNAKFRWGLAHGEGFCDVCKYPGRAYHFDMGPIKRMECILQYHPDELTPKKSKAAA